MGERIPLIGLRSNGRKKMRGLKIRASDCADPFPPAHVNAKHRDIQQAIDRRKVRDGEEHGWIEHDGEQVTDWHIDDCLLRRAV